MKFLLHAAVACAAIGSANPLGQRDNAVGSTPSENEALQFALYLAHFQDAFYRQGLANFTQADFAAAGFDADFYTNLTILASEDHTQMTSLNTTLNLFGVPTVDECTYDFNVTNPQVLVTTASLIASVSVSAYAGGIGNFGTYQPVAASILAVQARHSSFLRAALGDEPFASPFDTPIDLNEAYTLAQLFVVECPSSNPLDLKTFPHLSSSFSNHGAIGNEITLLTFDDNIQPAPGSDQIYVAFLSLPGPIFAPATPVPGLGYNVTVPDAPNGYPPISGLTYVVLTSCNTTLTDDDILAGPATIEIYPK